MATIGELLDWMGEIAGPINPETMEGEYVALLKKETVGFDKGRWSFRIATGRNTYCINASQEDEKRGYLGCTALSRHARAGEDWLRGNDLPDGPLDRETWDRIVHAMVRYEIVPIKPDTRDILAGRHLCAIEMGEGPPEPSAPRTCAEFCA